MDLSLFGHVALFPSSRRKPGSTLNDALDLTLIAPPRPLAVIPAKAGIQAQDDTPCRARVMVATAKAPGLSLTYGGLDAFSMNGVGPPPHDR